MTITCPACKARYRHPGDAIIRTRNLQCGVCDHEWTPAPSDIKSHRMTLDAPAMAPELADLAPSKTIRTNLPVVVEGETETVKPAITPRVVDRAPQAVHTLSKTAMVVPMLSLAFATFVAGTILFKDAVMAKIPATVAYYQAAGLASENPGLQIANVSTDKRTEDGIAKLIVKGEVLNVADNTVPVPPLKLIMRDKGNDSLYAWTVTTTRDSLKKGEKSRFTAVATDIPDGAVNVDVEFAPASAKTGQ
ncbi:MAG: hypothetical protein AAF903_01265 [Pseudomonadota bacterium]